MIKIPYYNTIYTTILISNPQPPSLTQHLIVYRYKESFSTQDLSEQLGFRVYKNILTFIGQYEN